MHTVVLVLVEVLIVLDFRGLGCRWIKQPLVIGEIIAGIMLGPSLFGLVAPGLAALCSETVPFLNVLSQVGLIFFMFLIGELNPKYQRSVRSSSFNSHVSILVPFSGNAGTAFTLVSNASVSFTAFALFLGGSLSVGFQYWRGYYRKQQVRAWDISTNVR